MIKHSQIYGLLMDRIHSFPFAWLFVCACLFGATSAHAVNIAVGQPTVASSVEGPSLPASNAVDDNASTRWSSLYTDNEWIYVDLGANYDVDRVVLHWEFAHGSAYQIQVSNDATAWSTVFTETSGDGGVDDITFAPVSTRYVRMLGTDRGTIFGYSLFEFEIHGQADPPVFTSIVVTPASTTVATLGTANFTAEGRDQYNDPFTLPGPVVWSVPPAAGTIDGSGLFTAGSTEGGPHTVTATVNAISGTAQVTVSDGGTPSGNLAEGQPVTASSMEGPSLLPSNAVDGNPVTRWSSLYTDNEWIYVDLGANYDVNRVVLVWEFAHGSGYLIQVSNDAVNWTTVFTETAGDGFTDDITFTPTNARYVRMFGTQRGTIFGYSLFEFEVHGTVDPPVFTSIVVSPATATVATSGTTTFTAEGRDQYGAPISLPGAVTWSVPPAAGTIDSAGLFTAGTTEGGPHTVTATVNTISGTAQVTIDDGGGTPSGNLAEGQPATASSQETAGLSPANAVDGNGVTRWSSLYTDNEWIYVDLGANYNVNRVVLNWEFAHGSGYLIQVSDDAVNWTTVFTETAGDGFTDDITFTATSARYVRMFGTQRGTIFGYSLFEFEVYGIVDPPVFTSIVVTPATATVATSGTTTFTAEGRDQYGAPISLPGAVTWSVPPAAGTIDSAGLFTAGTTEGGPHTVTATVNTISGTAQVTVDDGGGTPSDNLAEGQPVTASSEENATLAASNAVDGNGATRWASNATDNEWIYVDLGANYDVNRVVLVWEFAHGSGYLIQVSNDAVNWTTVFTETAGDGFTDDITFSATNARYVRMFGTQRGTIFGYSLFEFEVYGTVDPPVFTSIVVSPATATVATSGTTTFTAEGRDQYGAPIGLPGAVTWSVPPAAGTIDSSGLFTAGTTEGGPHTVTATVNTISGTAQVTVDDVGGTPSGNLASGQPAFASSEQPGFAATNAFDGNGGTRWSSNATDNEWIYVDLGTNYDVNRVVLSWEFAFGAGYLIQVSDDAVSWTTVFTETAGDGFTDDITFTPVSARYVRMLGTQRGTVFGYSLFEFEVYALLGTLSLPFTDDFNDGNSAGWAFVDEAPNASSWGVTNNRLQQNNVIGSVFSFVESYHIGTLAYYPEGIGLDDYEYYVTATFIGTSLQESIGIVFRYQDPLNYYRLTLNSRYGFTRLEKQVGGVFTTLATNARGYTTNQALAIKVRAVGSSITVTINSDEVFAVTDGALPTGTFGLFTQDASHFDDVMVVAPSTAPDITISTPLAFLSTGTNQLSVTAQVSNAPAGAYVEFLLNGGTSQTDLTAPFTTTYGGLGAGEYTVDAILRDSGGTELDRDVNVTLGVSGTYMVTIGDSITNGIGDFKRSDNISSSMRVIAAQGYESLLTQLLDSTGQSNNIVFNDGVAGDQTFHALTMRIDSIKERHPDMTTALILLGTNDALASIPSGLGCAGAACDGTFKGNLQEIVDKLRFADYPTNTVPSGVVVYVANVMPAFTSATPFTSTTNNRIRDYNTVINTEILGITVGPNFFDFLLPSATENYVSLFFDTLHPNSLGHIVQGELWHNAIRGLVNNDPFILRNITISTANAPKQTVLEAGDAYTTDQAFTLTTYPVELENGRWTMLAHSDFSSTAATYLQFDVDRSSTVYVAFDASAGSIPDWLNPATSDWVMEAGKTITTTDPAVPTGFNVYSQTFAASETVTIGGASATGATGVDANLIVIAVEN